VKETEFDKFADEYRATHANNIRVSGESPEFFAAYKVRDVANVVAGSEPSSDTLAILDFGGGIGTSVPHFHERFPNARLVCLDVSRKSLRIASELHGGKADFLQFDGSRLPFPDGCFDIAFAACVFHHIGDDEHVHLLKELHRVVKTGGQLFVFEHNPFNPLTVHAVNTCPFDENAKLISGATMAERFRRAGFFETVLRYRIFFPRALAMLRPFERYMTKIPMGAQYYVAGRKT
jgi:ubiquinone/menaquinone biosynthesis C-methylase UbiE